MPLPRHKQLRIALQFHKAEMKRLFSRPKGKLPRKLKKLAKHREAQHFILQNGKPRSCFNLFKWAARMEWSRGLASDTVGETRVSTVFLGLNHSFCGGRPVLFETMTFGGDSAGDCWRYTSLKAAMRGHRQMVEMLRQRKRKS